MAASNSRSEAALAGRGFGFPGSARLLTPRQFDACRPAQYRTALRFVALAACVRDAGDAGLRAPVRFGLIVSKRMARKSVQRNLVKRILREAARHALPGLTAAVGTRGVDVLLRLKDAFPAAEAMPLATLRRTLRAEADTLLQRLALRLAAS